jgi:hypothetical protein
MTTYNLLTVWTARRTPPLQLAARLIAKLRFDGRPHSYWVHAAKPALVTVTFTMATLKLNIRASGWRRPTGRRQRPHFRHGQRLPGNSYLVRCRYLDVDSELRLLHNWSRGGRHHVPAG